MPSSIARVLSVVTIAIFVLGCGGRAAKVPTSYYDWKPELAIYHLKFPAGWKYSGDQGQGNQWAEFSSRSCKISLNTDLMGSLAVDTGGGNRAPRGDMSPEERKQAELASPATAVHLSLAAKGNEEYGSYKEGEVEIFQSEFGPSRRSEFSGKAGMTSVRGYRATVFSLDRAIVVFCHCPQADWQNFKPVFEEVLKSIAPGH